MKNNSKITSVKLIDGGLKGIEVKYAYTTVKNNRSFIDEAKEKKKAPVHEELETCFAWLKDHLLNICGYTIEESERKYLLNQLNIVAVEYTDKGVIIEGSLSVLDGGKFLGLKTPLIENEIEYPEFGAVTQIIAGVFAETKEYMEGKKVMSDEQFIIKFAKGKEGFDPEAVKNMSKDEIKDWATTFLEKECKSTVFHHEELTEVADEPQKEDAPIIEKIVPPAVEELPAIESFDWAETGTNPPVVPEGGVAPEKAPANDGFSLELTPEPVSAPADVTEKVKKIKKLTKKADTQPVVEEAPVATMDDDFSLGLTPPPAPMESTAKLKAS